MANYVGGDRVIVNRIQVTAAANLVDKTFVNANGAVPANAAKCTGGVVQGDTLSGDYATVKIGTGSMLEVIATGTVTAGNFVEILTSTFTTKDTTGVTGAGVQDASSTNVVVGRAITAGSVNDTVLIELLHAVNV
jgi:hypothetical protein